MNGSPFSWTLFRKSNQKIELMPTLDCKFIIYHMQGFARVSMRVSIRSAVSAFEVKFGKWYARFTALNLNTSAASFRNLSSRRTRRSLIKFEKICRGLSLEIKSSNFQSNLAKIVFTMCLKHIVHTIQRQGIAKGWISSRQWSCRSFRTRKMPFGVWCSWCSWGTGAQSLVTTQRGSVHWSAIWGAGWRRGAGQCTITWSSNR